MRYGYARVSSKDQNEKWQVVVIEKEGVDIIYMDKQSHRKDAV
ncbi:MAG: hypothetical protein RR347_08785 [Anaerovoracaceae bacterium]